MLSYIRKLLLLILVLAFGFNVNGQIITEINPDSAKQGEQLAVTITGSNTHFQQGSPTSVVFQQGTSTIIFPNSVSVQTNYEMTGFFSIDPNQKVGSYNVFVFNNIDGQVFRRSAFTIGKSSTGKKEVRRKDVEVYAYPNPVNARNSITVEFSNSFKPSKLKIVSSSGKACSQKELQEVRSGKIKVQLSEHQIKPGKYIVQLSDGKKSISTPIIVE